MSRLFFALGLAFFLSSFATVYSDGGSCSASSCKCRDGEKQKWCSFDRLHYSIFCVSFRNNSNFSDFFVLGRDGRDGKPGKWSSYFNNAFLIFLWLWRMLVSTPALQKPSSETPVVRAAAILGQIEALASVSCFVFVAFCFWREKLKHCSIPRKRI